MKLARLWLGIAGGEVCSFIDDSTDILVDLLQAVFVGNSGLAQPFADELDGIALGAHLLHLFPRAVFRRVRHGMAAITVGAHLDDHRACAASYPSDRRLACRLHRAR